VDVAGITVWDAATNGSAGVIDQDDGTEPTWRRLPSNPDYPVAYKFGAKPTLFATFSINPPLPEACSVSLRVKLGSQVLATKTGVLFGGASSEAQDIVADLPMSTVVGKTTPALTWEVALDGSDWLPVGGSGPHTVYSTVGDPKPVPFESVGGEGYPELYDKALEEACKAGSGDPTTTSDDTTDPIELMKRITQSLKPLFYNPVGGIGTLEHPLMVYTSVGVSCSFHASLLRGLFRSIGLDGDLVYIWGGTSTAFEYFAFDRIPNDGLIEIVSMRVAEESSEDIAPPFPHFTYHSVVSSEGKFYDGSYGKVRDEVAIDEALNPANNALVHGVGANAYRAIAAELPAEDHRHDSVVCPHPQ